MTADIAQRAQKVLKNHPPGEQSALVNVLHDIQGEFRYLPEEALRLASEHLQMSAAQVFGVASFFEGFHLKPRGVPPATFAAPRGCWSRPSAT
jgi:NADH:ubiquinone oxidoreductase subunit E